MGWPDLPDEFTASRRFGDMRQVQHHLFFADAQSLGELMLVHEAFLKHCDHALAQGASELVLTCL